MRVRAGHGAGLRVGDEGQDFGHAQGHDLCCSTVLQCLQMRAIKDGLSG
jgi:hypothetical protein